MLGGLLDLMIIKVSSNLDESMIFNSWTFCYILSPLSSWVGTWLCFWLPARVKPPHCSGQISSPVALLSIQSWQTGSWLTYKVTKILTSKLFFWILSFLLNLLIIIQVSTYSFCMNSHLIYTSSLTSGGTMLFTETWEEKPELNLGFLLSVVFHFFIKYC